MAVPRPPDGKRRGTRPGSPPRSPPSGGGAAAARSLTGGGVTDAEVTDLLRRAFSPVYIRCIAAAFREADSGRTKHLTHEGFTAFLEALLPPHLRPVDPLPPVTTDLAAVCSWLRDWPQAKEAEKAVLSAQEAKRRMEPVVRKEEQDRAAAARREAERRAAIQTLLGKSIAVPAAEADARESLLEAERRSGAAASAAVSRRVRAGVESREDTARRQLSAERRAAIDGIGAAAVLELLPSREAEARTAVSGRMASTSPHAHALLELSGSTRRWMLSAAVAPLRAHHVAGGETLHRELVSAREGAGRLDAAQRLSRWCVGVEEGQRRLIVAEAEACSVIAAASNEEEVDRMHCSEASARDRVWLAQAAAHRAITSGKPASWEPFGAAALEPGGATVRVSADEWAAAYLPEGVAAAAVVFRGSGSMCIGVLSAAAEAAVDPTTSAAVWTYSSDGVCRHAECELSYDNDEWLCGGAVEMDVSVDAGSGTAAVSFAVDGVDQVYDLVSIPASRGAPRAGVWMRGRCSAELRSAVRREAM